MSWLRRAVDAIPPFAVLGDPAQLEALGRDLALDVDLAVISGIDDACAAFASALPVLPVPLPHPVAAGKPAPSAAPTVKASIEQAVGLAIKGAASAVVTNPIAKHVMAAAGFPHPGHTEFLGALAREHGFDASPVMMLVGAGLRVVPVTIHIPLADVPRALTKARIIETARSPRPACGAVRHPCPAPRHDRAQPPCRRKRPDGRRGACNHRAGDRRLARAGS